MEEGQLSKMEVRQAFFFSIKSIYYCLGWVFIGALRLSLVAEIGGYSLVAMGGFLVEVSSLVGEHRL